MDDVVIVSALRTGVGKFGGTIGKIPAPELGAKVIAALLARTGVKPAKLLKPGDVLSIRNGQLSWEVTVLLLSERRGPAMVASMLYSESQDSRMQRERKSAMLKAERNSQPFAGGRPTKRARRQMIRFFREQD